MTRRTKPDSITIDDGMALLAVVGRGMVKARGTAARVFNAISAAGVNIKMIDQGSCELNIIIGVEEHDHEGRVITLEYEDFYLVCVYVPNSQRELTRLDYRMTWEDAFLAYIKGLEQHKPVVYCGDLNVAHKPIDLKNPKSNTRNAGFTQEERDKLTAVIDAGYVDTFRHFHPDQTDAYTWWSYMFKAREKNVGWRIDYFIASEKLRERLTSACIHPEVMGSDHCPVELVID
jgi:exodeoxyribonuclease-3